MPNRPFSFRDDVRRGLLALLALGAAACVPTKAVERSPGTSSNAPSPSAPPVPPPSTGPLPSVVAATDAAREDAAREDAAREAPWTPPEASAIDGPHTSMTLDTGRPVYWARRAAARGPSRLVAHLHGVCAPPSYSCGKWVGAGTEVGLMVCPTGNARCGDSPYGPASWEAPTWAELVTTMDDDLEASIGKVGAKHPDSFSREGAVLTGYSRGAFAVPSIARRHPGRWPYLVLIEANVTLTLAALVAAGVRAVALVAGELGTEIRGMEATQRTLERANFPARVFVMQKTGHPYANDIEHVMHEALGFVLAHPAATTLDR